MAIEKHPCEDGLTEECFERYPAWAKQAFAYKLIHTLFPPWLTRRLPKWLRLALIGEGAILPPGFIPVDGMIIPPGYTFPPGWTAGDPVPPGVTIPPGTIFPPGWTAGDPIPAGVTLEPGASFPPGWTPGDPVPPGITIPPGTVFPPGWTAGDPIPAGVVLEPVAEFPPGWTPGDPVPPGIIVPPGYTFPPDWTPDDPVPPDVIFEPGGEFPPGWTPDDPIPPWFYPGPPPDIIIPPDGPIPPDYVEVWEPGPVHRFQSYVIALKEWFWEPFNDFTTNNWSIFTYPSGSATITGGKRLKLRVTGVGDLAMIYRDGDYPYPDNYDITFITRFWSGIGITTLQFYTGTYRINFSLHPPDRVSYRWVAGDGFVDVDSFMDKDVTWSIQVRANAFNILRDGNPIIGFKQVEAITFNAGKMDIVLGNVGNIDIDEISILEYV